ncbi:DUF2779 domain-containing protein [Metamycoplasma hyosynoviae]|nr:DUF2779 domain-containing protein [Metamycoplasma hyosynoviae]MDC8913863.1 DUF2779 domain-containing protein [Metamycoplasma hyosynoviae]
MKKNEVYIDFEAITNPFARLLDLPSGTPYAYTLGLINENNTFETTTFIMDFNQHNKLSSIWTILRRFIVHDIHKINKALDIKDIVFVGHNPVLETNCIKKLFPNNTVRELISKQTISLSKLTAKKFNNVYWKNTRKVLLPQIKDSSVMKQTIENNGALASFAGYWLYTKSIKNLRSNDKKLKYFYDLDKKSLTRDLRNYSADDVHKMIFVEQNPEEAKILMRELSLKKDLMKILKNLNFDENLTIKEIKDKIWSL